MSVSVYAASFPVYTRQWEAARPGPPSPVSSAPVRPGLRLEDPLRLGPHPRHPSSGGIKISESRPSRQTDRFSTRKLGSEVAAMMRATRPPLPTTPIISPPATRSKYRAGFFRRPLTGIVASGASCAQADSGTIKAASLPRRMTSSVLPADTSSKYPRGWLLSCPRQICCTMNMEASQGKTFSQQFKHLGRDPTGHPPRGMQIQPRSHRGSLPVLSNRNSGLLGGSDE